MIRENIDIIEITQDILKFWVFVSKFEIFGINIENTEIFSNNYMKRNHYSITEMNGKYMGDSQKKHA